jgi:ATP-dependent DNA ligase
MKALCSELKPESNLASESKNKMELLKQLHSESKNIKKKLNARCITHNDKVSHKTTISSITKRRNIDIFKFGWKTADTLFQQIPFATTPGLM